jgi:pyruvate dehydrogenase E2 component (dihydrolipoamide acetyltransferase)
MTRSWSEIPMVTHHDRADISDLEEQRERFAPQAEEAGGRLTVTAIVVKVVAAAVRVHPRFNAVYDPADDAVITRDYVNVAFAVDTEHGLLVPVIRDADRKSTIQIAVELGELARRARKRKLDLEQLQGAGITVSNVGGLGTTDFSPIVNWPQVAIVGVGRAATEAVWTGDGFSPRLLLPLSLTYDHRVNDGADASRFLRWIAEALETPLKLVMEPDGG